MTTLTYPVCFTLGDREGGLRDDRCQDVSHSTSQMKLFIRIIFMLIRISFMRQVAVKVVRAPVWVAGRYRKLGRDISNSPWLPGKCRTSVSEELARGILERMNADSYKFNSAGE